MQKNYTEIINEAKAAIENRKTRSAWDRGVTDYAVDLLEELQETARLTGRMPNSYAECQKWMLNGADSWSHYSWSGCAFAYNYYIAHRLCTPSELRKTMDGMKKPNAREEWLDVQARALFQAAELVCREVLSRA